MRRWQQAVVVYGLLLLVSIVLMRFQVLAPSALGSATAPLSRVATVAADNVRGSLASVAEGRRTKEEVQALTRKNQELRQQNELLTVELTRLRQLTQITSTQAPNAVGIAQVVDVAPSPLLARLKLNKGSVNGLRVHMPVTVAAGLVGQVIEVSARQSTVIALVDPQSSVGVTLSGGRGGRGLAVGSPPNRLKAEFSLGVPVKVGDVLVSSSLGGVYPVGIRVGTVEKILPVGPNDVTRSVIVKPAVDVGGLTDVTVLGAL